MSALSWILILSPNIFLLSLFFKKVVPFANELEDMALENEDKKPLAILLSKIIFNFSLLIFYGFNFFKANSAAFDPNCFGFRISLKKRLLLYS